MTEKQRSIVIKYLQNTIDSNPQINPVKLGECIYCEASLDEGKPHNEGCHYLKAIELLEYFKNLNG